MPITEARKMANLRYHHKQDDIKVRVPAGMREEIRAQANRKGYESVNSYIIALIERDKNVDNPSDR